VGFPGIYHEKNLSTISNTSQAHPRLSYSHENQERPRSIKRTPRKGSQAIGRLILAIEQRQDF
jgi:hypothetical protein